MLANITTTDCDVNWCGNSVTTIKIYIVVHTRNVFGRTAFLIVRPTTSYLYMYRYKRVLNLITQRVHKFYLYFDIEKSGIVNLAKPLHLHWWALLERNVTCRCGVSFVLQNMEILPLLFDRFLGRDF